MVEEEQLLVEVELLVALREGHSWPKLLALLICEWVINPSQRLTGVWPYFVLDSFFLVDLRDGSDKLS